MSQLLTVLLVAGAVVAVLSGRENLRATGPGAPLRRTAGRLEFLAAAGLLAGLVFVPFGIAAAAGLVLLLAGAIGFHLRNGDPRVELVYPAVPLLLNAAAVAVGAASL